MRELCHTILTHLNSIFTQSFTRYIMFQITLQQIEHVEHECEKLRRHFDTSLNISEEERDMGIRIITKIQNEMSQVRQQDKDITEPVKRSVSKKNVAPTSITEEVREVSASLATATMDYSHTVLNAVKLIERATTQDDILELWTNDGMLSGSDKFFFVALGIEYGLENATSDDVLNHLLTLRETPTVETSINELIEESIILIHAMTDLNDLSSLQLAHTQHVRVTLGMTELIEVSSHLRIYLNFLDAIVLRLGTTTEILEYHQHMTRVISHQFVNAINA